MEEEKSKEKSTYIFIYYHHHHHHYHYFFFKVFFSSSPGKGGFGARLNFRFPSCQGDILSIDTAALTGEPLPRKYPSEEPLVPAGGGCLMDMGMLSFYLSDPSIFPSASSYTSYTYIIIFILLMESVVHMKIHAY
jgi:hypothetical protein